MKKTYTRYFIFVNGYSIKGSFDNYRKACKMFRALKGICEKGTHLRLYKAWDAPRKDVLDCLCEIKQDHYVMK